MYGEDELDWKEKFALSQRILTINVEEIEGYIKREVEMLNNVIGKFRPERIIKYENNEIIFQDMTIKIRFTNKEGIVFDCRGEVQYPKKVSIFTDGGSYRMSFSEYGKVDNKSKTETNNIFFVTQEVIDYIFKFFFYNC